jgi:hypothetical protein
MTTSASADAPVLPYTGKEFLDSFDDGREVWIYGERVKNIAAHPTFRNIARMALHTNHMSWFEARRPTRSGLLVHEATSPFVARSGCAAVISSAARAVVSMMQHRVCHRLSSVPNPSEPTSSRSTLPEQLAILFN